MFRELIESGRVDFIFSYTVPATEAEFSSVVKSSCRNGAQLHSYLDARSLDLIHKITPLREAFRTERHGFDPAVYLPA